MLRFLASRLAGMLVVLAIVAVLVFVGIMVFESDYTLFMRETFFRLGQG